MSKVIGIDVSKETFDVGFLDGNVWQHAPFVNTLKGFRKLAKQLQQSDHCVMEASGPYYLQLATFLYEQGMKVSVVNPLVIRRYAQMKLQRAKTDKKDARTIAEYAMLNKPTLWKPEKKHILHLRQMFAAIKNIDKQIQMASRQLQSFQSSGTVSKQVKDSLQTLIRSMNRQKDRLFDAVVELAKTHFEDSYQRLQTIPGIGPKTAILLTMISNDFNKFEHSRQLIAYIGFSPRVYQSGTSVKGKGHICKMGNGLVRKHLYMCSWTAKRYNKSCREMYDRLKAKGKPERVIKVALANKLLKQAFALIKSQRDFDENYTYKPCF